MKIRPLHDRIVVKRENESKTAGGILIPDTATEKPIFGLVIAVGEGKRCEKSGERQPLDLKVGQKVLFGKYAGTEIEVAGEKLVVMREDDVMGVVEA
jgi:chaperonin GroES